MKYLQGRKEFDLILREREIPVPVHNQVLVRVLACGICGTDLHFLRKKEKYTPLGHEISALVTAVGESATKVSAGEMVVVEDLSACGVCTSCKNGESHLCRNMTGLEGQSGMGEYLLVHENNLVPCQGLTAEQATFVEPSAVALTACLAAEIRDDSGLVIWGMGPIALLCVAIGKYFHAKEIVCVGGRKGTRRNQRREEAALALGADRVCYFGEESLREKLPKETRSVIVTSPPATLSQAVLTAGYGGIIVPLGVAIDGDAKAEIDVDDLIFHKKKIVSVLAEPARYFPRCMELIRTGVIPTEKLLTHRISLTDPERFRQVFTKDEETIKAIIVN